MPEIPPVQIPAIPPVQIPAIPRAQFIQIPAGVYRYFRAYPMRKITILSRKNAKEFDPSRNNSKELHSLYLLYLIEMKFKYILLNSFELFLLTF